MNAKLALSLCATLAGCGAKTLDAGGHAGAGGSTGGSTPVEGTHSTVLIPHLLTPSRLAVEKDHLYWSRFDESGGEIARCEKRDCPSTQQVVFRDRTVGGLAVRNETLYFGWQGGIAACPTSDCSMPSMVVKQGSAPAFVDDTHVFWLGFPDNAFLSCPLTGCDMATAAPAAGIGRIVTGIAADEVQIYWTTMTGAGPVDSFSLMSARKDGTGNPKTMVSGLAKPTSLVVDGGFVYWATLEAAGTIARCPASGCVDGKPEVVASQQLYPHYLTASDGVIFWLDETEASDKLTQTNRPAKVVGCKTSSCADSIEVLDESMAGSLVDPLHVLSMPPDQMVADAEALYWFGDVTLVTGPDGSATGFAASVRRLARTSGR